MAQRFLVSTTHHLLAIDPEERKLWRVHSGSGLYYGLAKDDKERLYVGCRNAVLGPQDESVRETEAGSILVLDRGLRPIDELQPPFPLRDVHGMDCFDGRLWVTCSFDNMVAIRDLTTGEWSRWYPAPNPNDRGHDVHHFNTVCRMEGQICIVAHRFGPSELLFYDRDTLQLNSAIALGAYSHDVFRIKGAIATCSSRDGRMVSMRDDEVRTGNVPRGIALTPSGNLMGISVNSRRAERHVQSGILRWYTPDWHFRADYLLPRVGMVLAILEAGEDAYDWENLEVWREAEITAGEYNRLAPGNLYEPNSFSGCAGRRAMEWHAAEESHCWSASRRATLSIHINPGETRLRVRLGSALPGPYGVEIRLGETLLGVAQFSEPGIQDNQYGLPVGLAGSVQLSFQVPHLWRPAETISGNLDERLLGVAVYEVTLAL
ncbi:MAG TPA: hypothetical protein VHW09_16735 [Bryobacteraceae bacterium]|jgi:hypothetical protein|nr:hypothetical protein [Bryobacteraceae bacterium]